MEYYMQIAGLASNELWRKIGVPDVNHYLERLYIHESCPFPYIFSNQLSSTEWHLNLTFFFFFLT